MDQKGLKIELKLKDLKGLGIFILYQKYVFLGKLGPPFTDKIHQTVFESFPLTNTDPQQAVVRGALRQQTAFTLVLLAMERSVAMIYITKVLFDVFVADNDY